MGSMSTSSVTLAASLSVSAAENAAGANRGCDARQTHLTLLVYYRTNRGPSERGFIPAETLVQNGTAGDNGTTGGALTQPVLGFLVG